MISQGADCIEKGVCVQEAVAVVEDVCVDETVGCAVIEIVRVADGVILDVGVAVIVDVYVATLMSQCTLYVSFVPGMR